MPRPPLPTGLCEPGAGAAHSRAPACRALAWARPAGPPDGGRLQEAGARSPWGPLFYRLLAHRTSPLRAPWKHPALRTLQSEVGNESLEASALHLGWSALRLGPPAAEAAMAPERGQVRYQSREAEQLRAADRRPERKPGEPAPAPSVSLPTSCGRLPPRLGPVGSRRGLRMPTGRTLSRQPQETQSRRRRGISWRAKRKRKSKFSSQFPRGPCEAHRAPAQTGCTCGGPFTFPRQIIPSL